MVTRNNDSDVGFEIDVPIPIKTVIPIDFILTIPKIHANYYARLKKAEKMKRFFRQNGGAAVISTSKARRYSNLKMELRDGTLEF